MPVIVPIRDMRDTAKFAELVETSPTPVTVTKNGYGKFVVMRMEDYDAIERDRAKAHLMERIAIAERERREGLSVDFEESLRKIEAKYGL